MTTEVRTQFLFTMRLLVGPQMQMLGRTPFGDRRIAQVTGGSFEGPRLRGAVMPGGGDWILLRPDGVLQLDVRLTLQTEDQQLIYMTYRGHRMDPPTLWNGSAAARPSIPLPTISARLPSSRQVRPPIHGSTASSPWA